MSNQSHFKTDDDILVPDGDSQYLALKSDEELSLPPISTYRGLDTLQLMAIKARAKSPDCDSDPTTCGTAGFSSHIQQFRPRNTSRSGIEILPAEIVQLIYDASINSITARDGASMETRIWASFISMGGQPLWHALRKTPSELQVTFREDNDMLAEALATIAYEASKLQRMKKSLGYSQLLKSMSIRIDFIESLECLEKLGEACHALQESQAVGNLTIALPSGQDGCMRRLGDIDPTPYHELNPDDPSKIYHQAGVALLHAQPDVLELTCDGYSYREIWSLASAMTRIFSTTKKKLRTLRLNASYLLHSPARLPPAERIHVDLKSPSRMDGLYMYSSVKMTSSVPDWIIREGAELDEDRRADFRTARKEYVARATYNPLLHVRYMEFVTSEQQTLENTSRVEH